MQTRCTTWTGKHCYEPRYDEVEIPGALKTYIDGRYDNLERNDYIRNVYVCDICIYCGDTIDRLPNV